MEDLCAAPQYTDTLMQKRFTKRPGGGKIEGDREERGHELNNDDINREIS